MYLATHESRNFGGETPKKGKTPKLRFSNFTDFDIQIVYIGVNDPGFVFELSLLLHSHFGYFCQKHEKFLKNEGVL